MSGWFSVIGQVLALSSVVTMVFLGYKCEAKCEFKAIFNFGDSNSETGGFWAVFPAQSAPYGMTYFKKPSGRATDGRLIIDFLGSETQGRPAGHPFVGNVCMFDENVCPFSVVDSCRCGKFCRSHKSGPKA
ncbi:hypothetical protein IFM89_029789 [Coptis chinensis]|uniref:Uncharacterized protein n=1 Tax=Coptis chinensis TaxID=261450 RepID=A0A835M4V4_9MAGN|nr:hypothetical protein IFM89_029789 [Coptis chinensis]